MPAMVASTRVSHATGLNYGYVFAYARKSPEPEQSYQSEDAVLSGPVVAADNSGYTGSGYADYQHASGDYVEWTVQAAAAGTCTLQFRYANGDTADRPLAVSVNGTSTGTAAFASTGSWTAWDTEGMTVTLEQGENIVRATATGSNGSNLDRLGVSRGTVPVGPSQQVSFRMDEIGVHGPAYVYDYFAGTGSRIAKGGTLRATVTTGTYWVVAPVGPSGIAFLGDAGKFVPHGAERLTHLSDDGKVHATVAFATGEGPVTLHGHATRRPAVTASAGSVGKVGYTRATGLFTVTATAAESNRAVLTITP
jgi:hypothetical protein